MQLQLGGQDPTQLLVNAFGHRVLLVSAEGGRAGTGHHEAVAFGDARVGVGSDRNEVRGAEALGHPLPAPAALGPGRLHGQAVHQVVHPVLGVPLHPCEAHPLRVRPNSLYERLPDVSVGDGLLGLVEPAPGQPPLPPAVPEAVDHVGRVAHHLEPPLQRRHRLQGGPYLHALVRGLGVGPAGVAPAGYGPRPSAGPRVPEAGAVGVHLRDHDRLSRNRRRRWGSQRARVAS